MNVAQSSVAVGARPHRWALLAGVTVGIIEVLIAIVILWAVNQPPVVSNPTVAGASVMFDATTFRRGEREAITLPARFDPVKFRAGERETQVKPLTFDVVAFRRGERELR